MAYSATINLVTGDTLPQLSLSLKDANEAAVGKILDPEDETTWKPINLSEATVVMRIRPIGSLTVSSTLPLLIVEPETGVAVTDFPDGTLAESGLYEAEVEINYANGGKQTVLDFLKLKIRDGFD